MDSTFKLCDVEMYHRHTISACLTFLGNPSNRKPFLHCTSRIFSSIISPISLSSTSLPEVGGGRDGGREGGREEGREGRRRENSSLVIFLSARNMKVTKEKHYIFSVHCSLNFSEPKNGAFGDRHNTLTSIHDFFDPLPEVRA